MSQAYLINRMKPSDDRGNDVCNSLEVLNNLVYLTRHSLANETVAVNYLNMAEAQLRRLNDLLRAHFA